MQEAPPRSLVDAPCCGATEPARNSSHSVTPADGFSSGDPGFPDDARLLAFAEVEPDLKTGTRSNQARPCVCHTRGDEAVRHLSPSSLFSANRCVRAGEIACLLHSNIGAISRAMHFSQSFQVPNRRGWAGYRAHYRILFAR